MLGIGMGTVVGAGLDEVGRTSSLSDWESWYYGLDGP